MVVILALLLLCYLPPKVLASSTVTDSLHDGDCLHFAKYGDHLLLEYSIQLDDFKPFAERQVPDTLFHIHLDPSLDQFMIKGMCLNSSRLVRWPSAKGLNFHPFTVSHTLTEDLPVSLSMTLHSITEDSDYEVFDAFKNGNTSRVLHLINEHKGVNAKDSWGNTLLMLAVQAGNIHIISALLNARKPAVDVNAAKAVRYLNF